MYQPLSFTSNEMGKTIKKLNHKKVMYEENGPGDYNLTVDLAYEVEIQENPDFKYNVAKNVPIIKRLTEQNTQYEKCFSIFHGNFNWTTKNCVYFVKAKKICLVLEIDERDKYQLAPDYENFKCNYFNHAVDYVMFGNMNWNKDYNRMPPTINSTNLDAIQFEIFMNQAPDVRTLFTIDVNHFDFNS
jgi:hypothetical protein